MRRATIFLAFLVLVPLSAAGIVYGLFSLWGKGLPSPKRPQELRRRATPSCLTARGCHGELFVRIESDPARADP
jgi:hypothetical protein